MGSISRGRTGLGHRIGHVLIFYPVGLLGVARGRAGHLCPRYFEIHHYRILQYARALDVYGLDSARSGSAGAQQAHEQCKGYRLSQVLHGRVWFLFVGRKRREHDAPAAFRLIVSPIARGVSAPIPSRRRPCRCRWPGHAGRCRSHRSAPCHAPTGLAGRTAPPAAVRHHRCVS